MTKQELFNKSALGIIAQRGPSMGLYKNKHSSDGCKYRSENGSKCGIGHLIPDERYDSNMEHKDVLKLLYAFPSIADDIIPDDISTAHVEGFLTELQSSHDRNAFCRETFLTGWKSDMLVLARVYDLDTKVLEGVYD